MPPCPTWNPNTLVSPYYPCPGQKLGLPKDEAAAALPPEIRELLDTLLRMYREPGLFTDRRKVLAAIGVKQVTRRWHSRYTNMPAEEPMHFTEDFAKEGLFARPGWSGSYGYHGWSDKGKSWYVDLIIRVNRHVECINSRAVEGYLDLFLQTGLKGKIHPVPPERWYRHGIYGAPYALPLGPLTPNFGMGFGSGCLTDLVIYRAFEYQHVGDEHGITE